MIFTQTDLITRWTNGEIKAHDLCLRIRRMDDDEAADLRGQIAEGYDKKRHPITVWICDDEPFVLDGWNRCERTQELLKLINAAVNEGLSHRPEDTDILERLFPIKYEHGCWHYDGEPTDDHEDEGGGVLVFGDRIGEATVSQKAADEAIQRIMPAFEFFEGTEPEARDFVWRENLARRQLSSGAKAMLITEIYGDLADEGKRRRQQNLAEKVREAPKGRAREVVARRAGVSPTAIDRSVFIDRHAPEVLGDEGAAKLRNDITTEKVKLGDAWKALKREKKKQERAKAAEAAAAPAAESPGYVPEPRPLRGSWSLSKLDALDMLASHPAESVDLIHMDPPYFLAGSGKPTLRGSPTTREEDWDRVRPPHEMLALFKLWTEAAFRVAKRGGALIVHGTRHNIFAAVHAAAEVGWEIATDLIWDKPYPPPRLLPGVQDDHEYIVILTKGKAPAPDTEPLEQHQGEGKRRATITMPPPGEVEKAFGAHPTQKPIALAELLQRMLRIGFGSVVAVPFCGSGTEALAAASLGATVYASDREEEWVTTTRARLSDADRKAFSTAVTSIASPGREAEAAFKRGRMHTRPRFVVAGEIFDKRDKATPKKPTPKKPTPKKPTPKKPTPKKPTPKKPTPKKPTPKKAAPAPKKATPKKAAPKKREKR